ncbi:hypothetical protein ACFX13_032841 [Malus domestica]
MFSQRSLSGHSVFLILGVPLQANDSKAKISHITRVESKRTDCLEPFPDCLPSTALEYSPSTAAVLLKKLPHLLGGQIRQVKMIPCSM